jgi:tartrate dehydratase alpha subunit/fumarate hydratase class I-like protein
MRVKCPHCKRTLNIPYEKIKQRVLDENPSSYGPWIAAIIVGIGIAGTLGLIEGMVLTRSKEQKAQIKISQLQKELAKFTIDRQTTTAELKQERNKHTSTELKEKIEIQTNDEQSAIEELNFT